MWLDSSLFLCIHTSGNCNRCIYSGADSTYSFTQFTCTKRVYATYTVHLNVFCDLPFPSVYTVTGVFVLLLLFSCFVYFHLFMFLFSPYTIYVCIPLQFGSHSDHSPLGIHSLLLLPSSSYPGLQVYVATPPTVLFEISTVPFSRSQSPPQLITVKTNEDRMYTTLSIVYSILKKSNEKTITVLCNS